MTSEERREQIVNMKKQYLMYFDIVGGKTEDDLYRGYVKGNTSYEDLQKYLALFNSILEEMRGLRNAIERLESGEE